MKSKIIECIELKKKGKEICLTGLIIIFLSLFIGYWTASHIYAEDGNIETTTKEGTTETITESTEDKQKEMLEELNKKIEEMQKEVDEKIESLDEDNKLILNYLEIEQELEEVKKEVDETLNPPEDETKAPGEENIILDTETQYQYFPYITIIIALLMILVFRRKH